MHLSARVACRSCLPFFWSALFLALCVSGEEGQTEKAKFVTMPLEQTITIVNNSGKIISTVRDPAVWQRLGVMRIYTD